MSTSDLTFLAELENIVHERLQNPREASYTASLAAAGTQRIAQKVGEEAVEVALASMTGNKDETLNEAADLVYHLVVLLASQGLSLADVAGTLQSRHAG